MVWREAEQGDKLGSRLVETIELLQRKCVEDRECWRCAAGGRGPCGSIPAPRRDLRQVSARRCNCQDKRFHIRLELERALHQRLRFVQPTGQQKDHAEVQARLGVVGLARGDRLIEARGLGGSALAVQGEGGRRIVGFLTLSSDRISQELRRGSARGETRTHSPPIPLQAGPRHSNYSYFLAN